MSLCIKWILFHQKKKKKCVSHLESVILLSPIYLLARTSTYAFHETKLLLFEKVVDQLDLFISYLLSSTYAFHETLINALFKCQEKQLLKKANKEIKWQIKLMGYSWIYIYLASCFHLQKKKKISFLSCFSSYNRVCIAQILIFLTQNIFLSQEKNPNKTPTILKQISLLSDH